MSETSHRRLVAQGPVCRVEACACGVLHVTIGALTLRLEREVVDSLVDTLSRALERTSPTCPLTLSGSNDEARLS